jgi:predicted nucleic acid-binding protein
MKAVFGDTFYFLALLNKNDEAHAKCVSYASAFSGRLVTTDWVLLELADGLAASRRRGWPAPAGRVAIATRIPSLAS